MIFVLDELDFPYQAAHTSSWNSVEPLTEEIFERNELAAYLQDQPETLRETTEVLVLTHHGYRILVQPTRERERFVLDRVSKYDPGLGSPYRDLLEEGTSFTSSRASLQAMWSLAMQQRGSAWPQDCDLAGRRGTEAEYVRPADRFTAYCAGTAISVKRSPTC